MIPELEDKLTGTALSVPTSNVSLLDLTVRLENETSYEDICERIKEECNGPLKGIMGYTEDPLVSSDFLGDERSCIVDLTAGVQMSPSFVKLVAWYDNEYAYSNRVVELVRYMKEHELDTYPPKTPSVIGSDNYCSSVCPDSAKAKCEFCYKFKEFCPYCTGIRKIMSLLDQV